MATKQKFDFTKIQKSKNPEVVTVNNDTQSLTKIIEKQKKETRKDNFDVRLIPRKKIRENKKNKYNLNDIEKLMDSILNFGLQQNLTSIYSLDEDMYILEAGHRRVMALDNLIKIYSNYEGNPEDENYQLYLQNVSEYEKGYPIKVSSRLSEDNIYDADDDSLESMSDSVLNSEIRLHITNQDIRDETPAERARNIQRLAHLYKERNRRLKRNDRINVNESIGNEFGITERQVADIMATENLIPELQEEFDKNNIILKNASAYARLDPEDQKTILKLIKSGQSVSKEELNQLKKERERIQDEKEKLAIELKNKQEELNRTKEDLQRSSLPTSSDPDKELLEKKVGELSAEIKNLKKQAKNQKAPLAVLSAEESSVLKYETGIKLTINDILKKMTELNSTIKNYEDCKKKLDENRFVELSTLSLDELKENINSLISYSKDIESKL